MSNCCSNGSDGCGMSAYWLFRFGQSFILYKFWKANTPAKFYCSLILVFAIGFLYEGFPSLRKWIDERLKIGKNCCSGVVGYYSWKGQMIRSIAHTAQSFYALTAMIIFMYNNGYLNLALLVGTFWGNFFFSRIRQSSSGKGQEEVEYKGMCH